MKRLATITAALALLALACSEKDNTPNPADPASPNAVLNVIEAAFTAQDLAQLKPALADNLTFYFNPADVGNIVNGYQIPPSWNYAEFTGACQNMFVQAYDITLKIDEVGAPGGASDFTADNVSIDLVVMVNEMTGYRANQGYCKFKFTKQGDGSWALVAWWDHTSGGRAGGEPTSLGHILAMYH